ncbi:MAG: cyclic nucleotide-binding domain-containing protein, partial [Proteobacteria bacterium]|nr:cyclic nucleotide-binding domain-containing protein [Pseudomonadota bacterium]
MVAVSMLAKVPLFASLDRADLENIAQTSHRLAFERFDLIIQEDERDDRLFVILSGSAEVFKWYGKKRQRHLTDLEPGAYFGELSLFNNQVRSATVKAKTKMEVLCLPKVDLFNELRRRPEMAILLLQTLGRKLLSLEALLSHTLGGFVS